MKKPKKKMTLRQRRAQTPGYENMTPQQQKVVDRGGKIEAAQVSGNKLTRAMHTLKEKVLG